MKTKALLREQAPEWAKSIGIMDTQFEKVDSFLQHQKKFYPVTNQIFRSLSLIHPEDVKVVIVGQDPYHGLSNSQPQANGLAFSVDEGQQIPPSLRNIYKELRKEGHPPPLHGNLTNWATQGVLLLNSTLTVSPGQAGSHRMSGWTDITNTIIKQLSSKYHHIVFLLWGNHAIQKKSFINPGKHLVLTSPHPSPYSADRGFFGNNHFKKTNDYLRSKNRRQIDWSQ